MTDALIAAGGTSAERLLVLAALAAPTDAERAQLRDLACGEKDWVQVLHLARRNATVPLVQHRLTAEGLFDRVPLAGAFQAVSDEIATANERRLVGAKELLRRFDAAGIRCVVLKGMLFASEVYGDAYYKRMNDIDILLDIEQIDAAVEIYRDLGMFSVSELLGKEPRVRERRSHHLPSFVSRDGALVVGTHWGLITPLAPYTIDYAAIWKRVRPIDFHGVPAWAMAHEDNLHHLCVHLPYYKTGVRELADIWNLVRYAGDDLDYGLVRAAVTAAGSHNLVYHALSLTQRLVPDERIAALVAWTRPHTDRFYRYDVDRKTRDIHTLLRSRSTHTATIEKAYLEFNATQALGEKVTRFAALWRNLLLVPGDEAARMSSLRTDNPLSRAGARAAAPYRLTRVFQRDLGRWLFPAALAKTVADLGVSAARTVRGSTGDTVDLAAFAARVGMTPEQLRAVADSQE